MTARIEVRTPEIAPPAAQLAPSCAFVVFGASGDLVLSLAFGVWLIVQIGWQDGLFGAVPRWDPR